MSANERGAELVAKYVDGIASREEMTELDALVASDTEVARMFVRATTLDANLSEHFVADRRDRDLIEALSTSAPTPPRRSALRALRVKRTRWGRRPAGARVLRLAVAASLLLAVGVALLWAIRSPREPDPGVARTDKEAPESTDVRVARPTPPSAPTPPAPAERDGGDERDGGERTAGGDVVAEVAPEAVPVAHPEPAVPDAVEPAPVVAQAHPRDARVPEPAPRRTAPPPYDYDRERAYDLRFVRLGGVVKFARGDDGRPMDAVERVPLKAGDGIDASLGVAVLETHQGGLVYVRRGTRLRLRRRALAGAQRLVLDVDAGAVYINEGGGPPIDIETPFGIASPVGTRYGAELHATRAVVVVRDGAVDVRSRDHDEVVRVQTGYQTEVAPGRSPKKPSRANVAAAFAWVRALRRHVAPEKPKPVVMAFQEGVSPTAEYAGTTDTLIVESTPDANRGRSPDLYVDGKAPEETDMDQYGLLRFDVTAIPEDSVIRAATITFAVVNETGGTYLVYEVKRPWDESRATWRQYAAGAAWEVAGAKGAGDRGVEVGMLPRAGTGELVVALNRDGLALVKRWIDAPSTNHGLLIANPDNNDAIGLASSKWKTASQRPKLTVTFVPVGEMP